MPEVASQIAARAGVGAGDRNALRLLAGITAPTALADGAAA